MGKERPERITYAQKKLLDLIDRRELRSWCAEHNLPHTTVYRLALGESIATYAMICSMVHLIPPAEWIYYTDEKIPYEIKTVPAWDPEKPSAFIQNHRMDYKLVAEKYDLNLETAKNLFVNFRTRPSVLLMRKFCDEADPIEFFTDFNIKTTTRYFPDRGDIVTLSGKTMLVLSRKKDNIENSAITAINIEESCKSGISLSGTKTKGFVNLLGLNTQSYSRIEPEFVEKVDEALLAEVIKAVRKVFR